MIHEDASQKPQRLSSATHKDKHYGHRLLARALESTAIAGQLAKRCSGTETVRKLMPIA